MTAYWSGFNGFNQISPENCTSIVSSQFKPIPVDNIKDIGIAWSCAVILSNKDVYTSGFCGKHSTFLRKLTKPNPVVEFSKVACNEVCALFTSEDGDCWQYVYNTEKWKRMLKFTTVETSDASTSTDPEIIDNILPNEVKSYEPCSNDERERKLIKICIGEIVNIALDSYGQAYSMPSPIPMPGIKITAVACGFEHCLLLDDCGRVYSSGHGMRGQLGCDALETIEVEQPIEIEALSGLHIVHIAAGGWHSAAVTACGILYTWGWNNSGQLGFPCEESFEYSQFFCENLKNIQIDTSVGCSKIQSKSLNADHEKIQIYDTKEYTKCPSVENGNNFINIDKCKKMKLTVSEQSVETNDKPQCSKKEMQDAKSSEMLREREGGSDVGSSEEEEKYVTVLAVPRAVDFPMDVDVVQVSCGNRHTVVLTGDGTVFGCGWNAYGQLGESPESLLLADSMIRVDIPVDKKISGIHCGGWNTVIFFNT